MNGSEAPSRPPRVLVISAHVGAGHTHAAKAVVEELHRQHPRAEVEHIDILDHLSRWYRLVYRGGYELTVTRVPWLYGLGHWYSNRPDAPRRGRMERVRLAFEARRLRAFEQWLLQRDYDLIVHTHFLAPPVVRRLIRQGRLRCPQMVVVTDFDVHRWWHCEDVARWCVPCEEAREHLRTWGIPPERVTVSGIPIAGKWLAPVDRDEARARWDLPADRPLVLLSGGTEFTCGPVVPTARRVLREHPHALVAVLAGRNKRLLGCLARLPEAAAGSLKPVPFTDRLHELAELAALMITKPGGMTVSECLARGTPMVLPRPIPGQERGNARWAESHNAAIITHSVRQTASTVAALLADPSRLHAMSRSVRELRRPSSQIVVQEILHLLEADR